ncbi:DUF2202 domain-containing protein [Clostridium felsineum]|uniref:ferritin-like domain-containing protein n=1 Tax=Clostridium felsineum TaxID=36839 RepID=UPI00214D541C|nr:DUF2202 domain-containing protein [Clostridium felsineum]MCR3759022.1 DUF2202 domain-containing protein [Clostridium felsineum]
MVRKLMKRWVIGVVIGTTTLLGTTSYASSNNYGSVGVRGQEKYTLENMLTYAIEDEYLAKSEYKTIINQYGDKRPFSNIILAEEKHISLLKDLFKKYNLTLPKDNSSEHIVKPDTLEKAFKTGVKAEEGNIAMYEKFLSDKNLPSDLKEVFETLREGSQKHLKAFERGVNNGNEAERGNGRKNRLINSKNRGESIINSIKQNVKSIFTFNLFTKNT